MVEGQDGLTENGMGIPEKELCFDSNWGFWLVLTKIHMHTQFSYP